MADQGDQLALATGLDPQDAKAILGVLVSDALDQSGEHLAIGWRGLAPAHHVQIAHSGPSIAGPVSSRLGVKPATRPL